MTRNRGTKNFKSRLSEDQVRSIYLARGKISQKKLALKYKVNQSTIAHIQTGRSWGWLTVKLNGELHV